jgi:hypothetical protein
VADGFTRLSASETELVITLPVRFGTGAPYRKRPCGAAPLCAPDRRSYIAFN